MWEASATGPTAVVVAVAYVFRPVDHYYHWSAATVTIEYNSLNAF